MTFNAFELAEMKLSHADAGLAAARLFAGLHGQAVGAAVPRLAARCAYAGADRGLDPARRPAAEDRRLRPVPVLRRCCFRRPGWCWRPTASRSAPPARCMAALVACGQTDAKRLVAYTSIAHMSIVLMGIAAGVQYALAGAGGRDGGAFVLGLGAVPADRRACTNAPSTRDLRELGGLQQSAPRFAAAFALFCSALLALPGTANFVGEALVVVGIFQVNWVVRADRAVDAGRLGGLRDAAVEGRSCSATAQAEVRARHELARIWRRSLVLAVGTLVVGLYPQSLMVLLEPAIKAALVPHLP